MTLDFIRLPYVEATLAEVHRCGSILPGAVRHKAMKDSYIGSKIYISKQCHDHDILASFFCIFFSEHFIPKDTLVNAMLFHVMSDPKHWKDHDQFVPERFIDSQGNFQRDERLIPFGIGY